jgi:hypothetical protein
MQLPAGQAPNALNGRPTGQFRYVKNAADQSAVAGSAASTMNSFAEELKVENSSLSKNLKQNRDYGKVEAKKPPQNNKFDRLMEQYEHKNQNTVLT